MSGQNHGQDCPLRTRERVEVIFCPFGVPDQRYTVIVRNEFTAIVERDDEWYIAYCAEVPGANGQGLTREQCLQNLREAITLILDHRREDSLRAFPPDAERELVIVG